MFLLVQLGFDIKGVIASLGIGGIAIALAAKDTLTNFFGSLNIITDNSFSQGDWIEAGEVEGTVVDIRMRTTRIRTFENAMITVPNAQLANMSILNWSKRVIGRRIKMSLGITYDSKMSDIESLANDIKEMLQNHPLIATSKLNIDKKKSSDISEDFFYIFWNRDFNSHNPLRKVFWTLYHKDLQLWHKIIPYHLHYLHNIPLSYTQFGLHSSTRS